MMHKNIGKRVMALLLSLCMIAGMVDWTGLTVRAAEDAGAGKTWWIQSVTISEDFKQSAVYTGRQIVPTENDLTVTLVEIDDETDAEGRTTIADAEDYDIESIPATDNINVENGKLWSVKVTGVGEIQGAAMDTFSIQPCPISATTEDLGLIEENNGYIQYVAPNTSVDVPQKTLMYNGDLLTSADYNWSYNGSNVIPEGSNETDATLTFTGKGNFTGTKEVRIKFVQMSGEKLTAELKAGESPAILRDDNTIPTDNLMYAPYKEGEEKALVDQRDIVVKYDGTPLKADEYRLKYFWNGEETTNLHSAGRLDVKVVGIKGKYTNLESDVVASFFIRKSIRTSSDYFKIATQTYPGKDGTLKVEEADGLNTELTVSDPDARDGNLKENNSTKFQIEVDPSWKGDSPRRDPVTGNIIATATIYAKNGSGYFPVSAANGPKVEFQIEAGKLEKDKIEIENADQIIYDGNDWLNRIITPGSDDNAPRVKLTNGDYKQGEDYTVTKTDSSATAVNAKPYDNSLTITPTDDGRLMGDPVTISVTVNPRPLSDVANITATVTNGPFTYNGDAQLATPRLRYNNTDLEQNVDYTIGNNAYKNNINAGRASVTVSGRGNFTGEREIPFTIGRLPISENIGQAGYATVDGLEDGTEIPYTGSDIEIDKRITLRVLLKTGNSQGSPVSADQYTIEYENAAGGNTHKDVADGEITAKIKMSDTGNYEGTVERKFFIKPLELDGRVTISPKIEEQTYNGGRVEPFDDNIHQVVHPSIGVIPRSDYTIDYGPNNTIGASAGTIIIKANGGPKEDGSGYKPFNFSGERTISFAIVPCDISKDENLSVIAQGRENKEYDLLDVANLEEHWYEYTGKEKTFTGDELIVKNGKGAQAVTMTLGTDYEIAEYENNDGIGTARMLIRAVSSNDKYSGEKWVSFRIRGNLDAIGTGLKNVKLSIKEQIFSNGVIVPGDIVKDDVELTFQLTGEDPTPLVLGRDFEVTNANPDQDPTQVGEGAQGGKAHIEGKGDYFGGIDEWFDVIPLDLHDQESKLKDPHKYIISDIEATYPYSTLAITPVPKITHNDKPLTKDNDFTLKYYRLLREGENTEKQEITDIDTYPFDVGSYAVEINGEDPNYENATDVGYEIEAFDITGKENSRVFIEKIANQVVLDDIKYSGEVTPGNAQREEQLAVMNGDEVVWKNLEVKFLPVGIQENKDNPKDKVTLEYGKDYWVEYKNNTEPGEATYIIHGEGNFTGEIEKTFKIQVDLGGSHTQISLADGSEGCDFSPAGNEPEIVVTYQLEMNNGESKTLTLTEKDYTVTYDENEAATHPQPGFEEQSALSSDNSSGGKILIQGGTAEDSIGARDNENNPKIFKIYQRDISKYETDEDLELTGQDETYLYSGNPIIPELLLKCAAHALTPKGESSDSEYDYTITAEHNVKVWEEPEGTPADDLTKRQPAEYTVKAKINDQELYDGNYCGKFSGNFEITPRAFDKATIDTVTPIENLRKDNIGSTNQRLDEDGWRWAYDRMAINFPKEGEFNRDQDPDENGLEIKWNGENGTDVLLVENRDYTIRYENNTEIGTASIWIETPRKSNYYTEEPYEKNFVIVGSITEVDREPDANNPLPRYMELPWGDPETVYYGIVETFPDMKFTDYSPSLVDGGEPYILKEGVDFEIITSTSEEKGPNGEVSSNNTEVTKEEEWAHVVVRGKGNYEGLVERDYKILPKPISKENGITVRFVGSQEQGEYKDAYIFNGEKQEPEIEVFNNNPKDMESLDKEPEDGKLPYDPYQNKLKMQPIVRNSNGDYISGDYEIVRYGNNMGPASETGPSYVIIRAVGSNYTGESTDKDFIFYIVLRQMGSLTYTVEPVSYNGLELEPAVEVSYTDERNQKIVLDPEKDYDILEYKNNTNVPPEDATKEELPTIFFKGKGGYDGEHSVTFTIAPRDINSQEITATGAALFNQGGVVKPEITVKDAGVLLGKTLVEGTDYVIKEGSQSSETEIGATGTVTIEGKGNYTGTRQRVEFRIIPPNGVLKIDQIPDQNFNNQPIRPEITVSLLAEGIDTAVPLTENDYDVTYTNHQNAGTATVTVTGKAPFTGTATATFVIHPKKISNEDGTISAGMSLGNIGVQQYTGSPLTPKASLTFNPSAQPEVKDEEDPSKPVELIAGRDYILSYDKNVMPGKAKAIVKGINNYAGSLETEFEIHADMSKVTIAPIPVQDYTGSAVTPLPVVSLGGQRLTLDTDYRVTYSNNVDRGTATITIQGIEPWFVGKRTVNFDIARELSEETAIRGVAASYTYTGAAIAPPVRVEDDGNLLKSGVDYEISYSQNIDAGTATIVIKGIGKYTGSTSTTFKITPQQLGRAKISPISDRVYNGKEQKPSVTITSGDKTLENGKDYTLVYVNSTTPGMASVIVKGEGNFTGTQTLNYKITVPALSGVKFSKYTNKTVTISWKKNSVVTGYEIYNSKNRRALRIKSASTTSGTVKKLKAGTAATFRVRAYVNKDGQYYYGPFKSIKTATAPNSTTITSLTSKKAKQAVIKWKKVSGATQYEVYRSTSKKGKYKKIATTKKTSYTDKKATGGKKYYYKIRVCKKISKKNYYSSYSGVKSVKAKK